MPILGVIASSDRNAPDAPTIGTATNVGTGRAYNNGRADVTFTAPTYTGGLPITSYTVTSSPGGFTGTGASSPISVTGLQSGVSYTFTVTATNSAGTSAASAASNSITATTVPQAPTIGTATAGESSASVTFTAGATGGSAITSFTATSSPGSITGTAASSPITVSGLTNGTAYTFTVTATNANGTSAASAASNSVTPQAQGSFDYISELTGNGSANILTFTNIPQTYKAIQLRMFAKTSSNSSSFSVRMNSVTSGYGWTYLDTNGVVNIYSGGTGLNQPQWEINPYNSTSTGGAYLVVGEWFNYTSSTRRIGWRGNFGQSDDWTTRNKTDLQIYGATSTTLAAVTSLELKTFAGAFSSTARFVLYGIKDS